MGRTITSPCAMRILYALLTAVLLAGFAAADSRVPAPQFTATTLDGQTVSSNSLSGSVVLLQFWTTWCPVCRHDQPALDNIQAEFGSSGLVVLAVDDGESEAVVRKYLQASPRSCPVVVSDGHSLAARFGVHSYPHYVVIDQNGNITASKGGGGGEAYLRYLLRSAGLPAKSETQEAGNRPAPAGAGVPQWINAPVTQSTVAAKPAPKTIFVLVNGERFEADHYVLHATYLHVTSDGQDRSIPLSALDIPKTIAVNRGRGIHLKFPTNGSEVFLAF
ncbi:MAG: TlpA disulfide reductase family protein [Candidatus Korobacteraceae bacterium]